MIGWLLIIKVAIVENNIALGSAPMICIIVFFLDAVGFESSMKKPQCLISFGTNGANMFVPIQVIGKSNI